MIEALFRPTLKKRVSFFLITDLLFSLLSLYSAYLLRFNFQIEERYLHDFWAISAFFIFIKVIFLSIFGQYSIVWRFYTFNDAKRLLYAHIFTYLLIILLYLIFKELFIPFPRSVIAIDFLLSLFFLLGVRVSKRLFVQTMLEDDVKATLLWGIKDRFNTLKATFESTPHLLPVAIVESDDKLVGSHIDGVKIYSKDMTRELIEMYDIKVVIVVEKLTSKELSSLIDTLKDLGVEDIKRLKLLEDGEERLESIQIEELLAREPKDLDTVAIAQFVKSRTFLVTGAGGSIGRQICRELFEFGVAKILMVESSEYNLYRLTQELEGFNFVAILQNICDREPLEEIFQRYKIDVVIHTAAYKHVPLCEINPKSAIRNNILGAINIFELSIKYGIKKVVNISSDKAVRPTNVMGATKRVVELYAQNINIQSKGRGTEIVSVRFGNVLGSSGSVVPKFKEQIERGESLTVTHPEITRYFMLIDEACKLVLQAGAMAEGGELFILDMGEPVKIVDLAKKMIKLYGADESIKIEFIGLRAGEKLYEELLIDDAEFKTKYDSIYIAKATTYPIEKLKRDVEELLNSNDSISTLKKIVPEFKPTQV